MSVAGRKLVPGDPISRLNARVRALVARGVSPGKMVMVGRGRARWIAEVVMGPQHMGGALHVKVSSPIYGLKWVRASQCTGLEAEPDE